MDGEKAVENESHPVAIHRSRTQVRAKHAPTLAYAQAQPNDRGFSNQLKLRINLSALRSMPKSKKRPAEKELPLEASHL